MTGLAMRFPASRPTSVVAAYVLIAAALALYATDGLFSSSPYVIGLQVVAVFLSLWARVTFGLRSFHFPANPTPGDLVTTGPYRFIRNPIYAAVWLFFWTGIAAHFRPVTATLGILILTTLVVRIVCEERLLREHFPEYPAYARRTPRLIPFIL